MKLLQILKKINIILPTSIFLYFIKVSDFDNDVFFPSIIYIFLVILFLLYIKFDIFSKLKNPTIFKYLNFVAYLFLFFITLITQNYLLNYEVISWDVSSYLVASSDIGRGNLPYVGQWESKGPLFMIFYYIFNFLSDGDYIKFRIINDALIYCSSIIIFQIIKNRSQDTRKAFFGALFFLLLVSKDWYLAEISEIYYLPIIGLTILHLSSAKKNNYIYIGFLSSISTLINQSTVLFFIVLLVFLFINADDQFINNILKLTAGFTVPHLLFISIYLISGHIDIYIANYFTIPISYTGENLSSFYEIMVWIREYYRYEEFLYFSLILIIIFSAFALLKSKKEDYIIFLNIFAGLVLYFIAGHNYYHHLLYFLFFIPLVLVFNFSEKVLKIFYIQIMISTFFIATFTFNSSINNLKNSNQLMTTFPLYNLANEIKENNDIENIEILALDYVLILYYLDKPNFSYIVHPSNHFEEYIVDELIKLGYVPTNEYNHISYLIEEEPEIIICNSTLIVYGKPTKVDFYNCMVDDYKKNYLRLDTIKYQENRNIDYYYDPYKELRVFIKQKNN